MPRPENSAHEIRQYLLGELNEQDQLAFEERYFADEDSYQLVLALEDELRYDYAQGVLPAKQRARFERRFVAAPGGRERVRLAQAVLQEVSARAEREPAVAAETKSRWSWFSLPRMSWAPSIAAVAIVGSSYCLYELYRLRSQMGELDAQRRTAASALSQQNSERTRLSQALEQERARRMELEKKVGQSQPAHNPYLAFFLAPGLSRGGEGSRRLILAPGMDTVRLDLELKKAGFAAYRMELQTLDGDLLWSERSAAPGKQLLFVLPARVLRPGDYLVEVKGTTPGGETELAGDYYFTVVAPR